MKSFGRHLLDCGAITRAQHDEATGSIVVFGGRLGTHLVEQGHLGLEELERHLGEHLGVPVAPCEWMDHPTRDVLETVPTGLVERFGVFPLHRDKRELHLAMLDPTDPLAIDDLAFATGLRIVPYAIAETRLFGLLERHYGVSYERRSIELADDEAWRSSGPAPQRERDEPSGVAEDLIDEDLFTSLHATWSDTGDRGLGVPAPVADATTTEEAAPVEVGDLEEIAATDLQETGSVGDLESALSAANDREVVGHLALRIASRYAEAAALFVVRGGVISGFRGDGRAIARRIEAILLPVESDADVARPAATRLPFRGAVAEGGLDARVLASLGRSTAREIAVLPILIRGQVVNLLYTDGGDHALGDTAFAALGALAELVSNAYERLILRAKRQQ